MSSSFIKNKSRTVMIPQYGSVFNTHNHKPFDRTSAILADIGCPVMASIHAHCPLQLISRKTDLPL
ncbi:MAG: hypothetical protein KGJ90_05945 [Patescibacteria group bacterium]|nr:hypothetical protein [Patescibacteria group bacterium]MDE2233612.1 hypothetical protein [Patescibacteria group bacterium]